MTSELVTAVNQICADRGLNPDTVFEALKKALIKAYQREHGEDVNLNVEIDPARGTIHLYIVKKVVKKVKNPEVEISLKEAKNYSPDVKIGDELEIEVPIDSMGRIAAQTAKHVILNQVKDAERATVVEFYQSRLGDIVSGKIQRVRKDVIFVELEKGVAELPKDEQVPGEFYEINRRYKFLVKELINEENNRHIILSRKDDDFLRGLLRMEVPEIAKEQVEIKAIARIPGVRSKVAVYSTDEGIDAQGTCIGPRGVRITAIMDELGDEKVDIVKWDMDIEKFIKNALSFVKVDKIELSEKDNKAIVYIPEDQLQIAVGKEGVNVKLASMLTGIELEIEPSKGAKSTKK